MPLCKHPGGRPRAEEGQPPFPKVWKDTERLAGVLAYLEASENGPNANREGDARKAYAHQLDFVITEVKDFEVSKHKWGGGHAWALLIHRSRVQEKAAISHCYVHG